MVQGYSERGPRRVKWNTQPSTPLNSRVRHREAVTSNGMHNLTYIFVFVLTTQTLGLQQDSKVFNIQFQTWHINHHCFHKTVASNKNLL
jgi:hypothetical protein